MTDHKPSENAVLIGSTIEEVVGWGDSFDLELIEYPAALGWARLDGQPLNPNELPQIASERKSFVRNVEAGLIIIQFEFYEGRA